MKIPWKKIGTGIKGGLQLVAMINPAAAKVLGIVEKVQVTATTLKGGDKKALVESISDDLLSTDLDGLTPEQETAIKAARSSLIDAYVAARNAEAAFHHAHDVFEAAVAAVKK